MRDLQSELCRVFCSYLTHFCFRRSESQSNLCELAVKSAGSLHIGFLEIASENASKIICVNVALLERVDGESGLCEFHFFAGVYTCI